MSLMGEIRGSVAPRDIDRFDDVLLKKEIEMMKVNNTFFHNISYKFYNWILNIPII